MNGVLYIFSMLLGIVFAFGAILAGGVAWAGWRDRWMSRPLIPAVVAVVFLLLFAASFGWSLTIRP